MFEKYLQYEVEDWTLDDDFIQYVNGVDKQMESVIQHFKNDSEVFNKIKKASAIISGFDQQKILISDQTMDNLFGKINQSIDTQHENQKSLKIISFRNIAWTAGIAAAITLLIIFLPFTNGQGLQQFATNIGEQETIMLPDQSVVEINTLSSIEFNSKNWAQERTVKLQGEAFFKVEKGNKFSVKSNKGVVEVLGTQFNIYDRNGVYIVECLEGRVSVTLNSGETHILNGGDRLDQKENQNATLKRTSVVQIDWRNDYVELENESLKVVLEEMGRYYDFQIESNKDLESYPYSGFFTTKSLDSAIYQVLWPLNIEYERVGNKLIIK